MAAYAALVSLGHIIEQIQHRPRPPISLHKLQIQHHPRPPISLHNKQVESLTENVTFLQDFLESYSINGGNEDEDGFESRIADAAYAAEDIIESHIVDQILSQSKTHFIMNYFRGLWKAMRHREYLTEDMHLHLDLQKVIEEMDFIKKDAMEMKAKTGNQDQLHKNSLSAGLSRSPPTGQNTMVGFDDVLIQIMDNLTGQRSNRQIIPIVGMGGIGKTTLARNIYVNPLIVQYFDVLAWATISQDYSIKEIILEVLCDGNKERRENLSQMDEYELGDKLHKSLSGRRYLLIMDDIWSIDVWDKVKLFFPDNNNGSRIMITTRLSDMAFQLSCSSHQIDMNFLDEDKSWNLLCKNVFGEDSNCPLELEEIGKRIAKGCKGLPLSIVVIGGFLAKSQRTREYWEYTAENLNSIVNLEENERCLKILHMSYKQLPVHLKPCFLYMGVFPEDSKIRVSSLVKLWVAEGFLKPISGKSSEMIAEEYLKDLIDRNLILVHKLGTAGNIKFCIIHDLLRDLCLREAQKERFLNVIKLDNISPDTSTHRRICIPPTIETPLFESVYVGSPTVYDSTSPPVRALQSASLARSLICDSPEVLPPSHNFRLLRVLETVCRRSYYGDLDSLKAILQLVNSRYLAIGVGLIDIPSHYLSSVHLWNLQTLIIKHGSCIAPSEIWKMPQLRHVKFLQLDLPDPPRYQTDDGRDDFVLGNLQTLSKIKNFKCGEEAVKRIPNIKKLGIYYVNYKKLSRYCLKNLYQLRKLESFACLFPILRGPSRSYLLQKLIFPHSLKKLCLQGTRLHWEDMTRKIGSLPLLQVLKLKLLSFSGPKWETVEGQFCSLKFLLIRECDDLENWTTESSTHFPRLEHLVLGYLDKLKEIPSAIGEIATLKTIELKDCSDSAVISAKEILNEQEDVGNVGLQVRARFTKYNQVMESLASDNFIVELSSDWLEFNLL